MTVEIAQLQHIEYDIDVCVVDFACKCLSVVFPDRPKREGHLVDLETEQHIENAIKFVIFHDRHTSTYVVQSVPESLGSRTTRCV